MKKNFSKILLGISSSFLMAATAVATGLPVNLIDSGQLIMGAAAPERLLIEVVAPERPCVVLTLDGGGARGLLSARVAANLEKDLNEGIDPTSADYVPLSSFFDVVAGTSTGAIIGGNLAIKRSAKEIVDLYDEHLSDIFSKSCW